MGENVSDWAVKVISWCVSLCFYVWLFVCVHAVVADAAPMRTVVGLAAVWGLCPSRDYGTSGESHSGLWSPHTKPPTHSPSTDWDTLWFFFMDSCVKFKFWTFDGDEVNPQKLTIIKAGQTPPQSLSYQCFYLILSHLSYFQFVLRGRKTFCTQQLVSFFPTIPFVSQPVWSVNVPLTWWCLSLM